MTRRRDLLRQTLAGDLRALRSSGENGVGDTLDDALLWSENELYSQLAETESKELQSIEKALRRMRAGKYGECEVCEKAITMPRLEALPYASTCIHCARQAEEKRARMEENGWTEQEMEIS